MKRIFSLYFLKNRFHDILNIFLLKIISLFRKRKLLVIIGCGRSGTKYASNIFKKSGFDVGHEGLGLNGISSWCLVPYTDLRVWGPSWKEIKSFDNVVVHQVREPLKTISSLQTFEEISWDFIGKFINFNRRDSRTLRAMKYWYFWNKLAEKKAVITYKVEDFNSVFFKLCNMVRFNVDKKSAENVMATEKKANRRKHVYLTWMDLKNEDAALTEKIKKLAKSYRY